MRREWVRLGLIASLILFFAAGIGSAAAPDIRALWAALLVIAFVLLLVFGFWGLFYQRIEAVINRFRAPADLAMVERLPAAYIPRRQEFYQAYYALLGRPGLLLGSPAEKIVALIGPAGCGKTTLAQALCWDQRVRQSFTTRPQAADGQGAPRIFWVTLGAHLTQRALLDKLMALAAAATGTRPIYTDLASAAPQLRRALGQHKTLLVIDDAWREEDVRPFLPDGQDYTCLITTRDANLLPKVGEGGKPAGRIEIGLLKPAETAALLNARLPRGDKADLQRLADRLGTWPELAALVNGQLRDRVRSATPVYHAIPAVADAFQRQGITISNPQDAGQRERALSFAIELNLNRLSQPQQERFKELAIFPANEDIPLAAVEILWSVAGLMPGQTERLCQRLADLSLLAYHPLTRAIRLPEAIYHYLRGILTDQQISASHQRLLTGYQPHCREGWLYGPQDRYYYHHLIDHLAQAGRGSDAYALLTRYDWLKIRALHGVDELLSDYALAVPLPPVPLPTAQAETLQAIHEALCLAAHVLEKDPEQLEAQLRARLLDAPQTDIRGLLEQIEACAGHARLRPVFTCLAGPGGPEIRTLTGHAARVISLYFDPARRQLISFARDNTLKCWNLDSGQVIRDYGVGDTADRLPYAFAITRDGQKAVCSYQSGKMAAWTLAEGREGPAFARSVLPVDALAVSDDGLRAVTMTTEGDSSCLATETVSQILTVWDIPNGRELHHSIDERSVYNPLLAIGPGGGWYIYPYHDQLYVRDMATGQRTGAFAAQACRASCLALSPDGRQVYVGDLDGHIRVWDISGRTLWEIHPHTGAVSAILLRADNTQGVSCSADGSIARWDTAARRVTRSIHSLAGAVTTLAADPELNRVVTGFASGAIKVWNPHRRQPRWVLDRHAGAVTALSRDGSDGRDRRALSGAQDQTVHWWDINSGATTHTFANHRGPVTAVTVSPNGLRGASGAEDQTLLFLDLLRRQPDATQASPCGRILSLYIRPDQQTLLAGFGDGSFIEYDLCSGAEIRRLPRWEGPVHALAVTPDGNRAISSGSREIGGVDEKHLRFWDLVGERSAFMLDQVHEVTALAITPDGSLGVSGYDNGTLKLWQLRKDNRPKKLREIEALPGCVRCLLITSDNRFVVAGAGEQVYIWDRVQNQRHLTFYCNSAVNALALTGDERGVLAGDVGGGVYHLALVPANPLAQVAQETV